MTHPYEVRVEPDRLRARAIALVAIAGVLVIVGSAVLVQSWLQPVAMESAGGLAGAPVTVGALNVTMFPDAREGLAQRERQRAELEKYSWVDRQKGVVAIPIERAMQLVAGGWK